MELEHITPSNGENAPHTHSSEQQDAPPGAKTTDSEIVELSTWKFCTIVVSLCSACFLAGYDSTCVGTLGPTISDEFNSLNDVSWYGIAYSLASCATILSYGKFYSFYSARIVFASALAVFVIGSIICATAQSSIAFIVGRAVAGLGNAGIFSGCNIIATRIIPLRWRPFYQSFIGSMECIALATAPLIAGAIADVTSWRVCFWISVPLGSIPIISVLVFLRLPETDKQGASSSLSKLRQLDPVGMALFVPLIICFTLALQTGGTEYPWNSKQVILPLAMTGALLVAFGVQQAYMQEQATLPARLLKSRIMLSSIAVSFACSGALYVFTYYLPIYYQAIRDVSTMESGVRDLSRILGLAIAIVFAGAMTTVTGYYLPYMVLGGILMSIGAGLTTTFNTTTSLVHIILFQAIFGLGCGFAWQQPYIAVQASTPASDVPSAIVVLTFGQLLGGVVMLAISQNVFAIELVSGLATKVPGLDASLVLNSGALSLRKVIPSEYLVEALVVYNDALVKVFYTGMAIACVTTFGALGSGWRSVKQADKTR
ncbi:uncharacterized protein N7484_010889 [Penicillium longicatenatum]|uniref:uncharacterized protein n=1 Tax=Penicillium longicatenatum TaxID=1561947 RepID=UPI002546EAC2|nr:uncharacterized protein N7484_010889 [Penicillium longicatenatum]KAJ5630789.1 hypothetical protein N7484_010889 [Penicillium longicatenatum]